MPRVLFFIIIRGAQLFSASEQSSG